MEVDEIKVYLPHRYPFLLVDRVLDLIPGESIVALKNLSISEPVFEGHFPHLSVFPGVMLLEAMAQASGILGFKTVNKTPADGSIYYLAGADNVRFKRPCVPGDSIHLYSEILGERRGIWKFGVRAEVEGALCASATILCADR
tara:strand:+ start:718 stop:1146 length:429 start_codon:yes stop_codon:yes gene_type:complete